MSTITKIESVNNLGVRSKASLMRVRTNNHVVVWQPDTEIQKEIWDEAYFRSFNDKTRRKVKLTPTNLSNLEVWSSSPRAEDATVVVYPVRMGWDVISMQACI